MQGFKTAFLFSFFFVAFLRFSLPLWHRPQAESCPHLPALNICMAGSLPGLFIFLTSVTGKCRFACEDVTLAKPQTGEVRAIPTLPRLAKRARHLAGYGP